MDLGTKGWLLGSDLYLEPCLVIYSCHMEPHTLLIFGHSNLGFSLQAFQKRAVHALLPKAKLIPTVSLGFETLCVCPFDTK